MNPQSISAVCEVLQAADRRVVIDCLANGSATVDEVVAVVSSEGSSAEVGLHHCHLPKLSQHGVIEWEGDEIRRGSMYAETQWMLEVARSLDLAE